MDICFIKADNLKPNGTLAIAMCKDKKLSTFATTLDKQSNGAISRALQHSYFKANKNEILEITAPHNLQWSRLMLVATEPNMSALDYQVCGAKILAKSLQNPDSTITIIQDDDANTPEHFASINMAFGMQMRHWHFKTWLTKQSSLEEPHLEKTYLVCADPATGDKQYQALDALYQGISLTRDLVSAPPNVLYPESFAEICQTLEQHHIKVSILDEKQMHDLGMHALLGVGQGSTRASKIVAMQWNGDENKNAQPIAFIGKGVTFDTGGISLKAGPGMEQMKWDMGGGGVVTGLMKTLALRHAPVNVIGLIGLVENMPDGNAQRPGDIVRSMSGQTIEIHNTDAEGRLVLADVLHYCVEHYQPSLMIDLATLTGAMIIALGHEYAGLFSNDDELSAQLSEAGFQTGDRVWRMPLDKAYDKLLKTDSADMKNIGGRGAGSITAAQFLQRFVGSTKWAHLDIAGTTWQDKDRPLTRKGATGFGVALLDQFVKNNFG